MSSTPKAKTEASELAPKPVFLVRHTGFDAITYKEYVPDTAAKGMIMKSGPICIAFNKKTREHHLTQEEYAFLERQPGFLQALEEGKFQKIALGA